MSVANDDHQRNKLINIICITGIRSTLWGEIKWFDFKPNFPILLNSLKAVNVMDGRTPTRLRPRLALTSPSRWPT